MVESVTTLFRPSAAQKRLLANGRSAEITSTTVFVRPPALSLNLRVDVAHTAVSRLGTMLSTLRLPAYSASETSLRSLATRVKPEAFWPGWGNVPATSTGLPLSVTVAILFVRPFGKSSADGIGVGPRGQRYPNPHGRGDRAVRPLESACDRAARPRDAPPGAPRRRAGAGGPRPPPLPRGADARRGGDAPLVRRGGVRGPRPRPARRVRAHRRRRRQRRRDLAHCPRARRPLPGHPRAAPHGGERPRERGRPG